MGEGERYHESNNCMRRSYILTSCEHFEERPGKYDSVKLEERYVRWLSAVETPHDEDLLSLKISYHWHICMAVLTFFQRSHSYGLVHSSRCACRVITLLKI